MVSFLQELTSKSSFRISSLRYVSLPLPISFSLIWPSLYFRKAYRSRSFTLYIFSILISLRPSYGKIFFSAPNSQIDLFLPFLSLSVPSFIPLKRKRQIRGQYINIYILRQQMERQIFFYLFIYLFIVRIFHYFSNTTCVLIVQLLHVV